MLYNMFAGMMRGIGNSFMPLVWVICAVLVFVDYRLLMRKMKEQDLAYTIS